MEKPRLSGKAQQEIDNLEKILDTTQQEIKNLDNDVSKKHPFIEREMQTKLSSRELDKKNVIHLTPNKWVSDNQKFNEKFRNDWNFQKERVDFIAENVESKGERIEMWTHPFGGVGAEYWIIPVNIPINAPRYVAEQIKKNCYVKRVMDEKALHRRYENGRDEDHVPFGSPIIEKRIDANPIIHKKSVFMGGSL